MKLVKEIKRILLFLIIAITAMTAMADNHQAYNQARAYYRKGNYQQAIETLSKIKDGLLSENVAERISKCKKCLDLLQNARAKKMQGDEESAYNLYHELWVVNDNDPEAKQYLKTHSRPSQAGSPAEAIQPKVGESPRHASSPVIAEKKEEKHPDVEYFYMQDGKKVYCYMNPERPQMTYHEALEYCRNLELAGKRGWRLPTMDEMMRFYNDYPHEKGKLIWVGYKGVVINNMTVEENEANSNMKYCPCIDGRELVVHPFRVNSRNEVVAGEVMRHHFFPVRTE